MQRLALDFVRPEMVLGRDVYGLDGTIMVAAGTLLTERLISRLRKWEISSVFVNNPRVDLPDVPPALQEETRSVARHMVSHAFDKVCRAEKFALSEEDRQIVHSIVAEATQDPRALIHMARIDRNSRDLLSHSVNVALLSIATALSMGIRASEELQDLALACLLHDIGLLMIPRDLILRRCNLSREEFAIYREHCNWGFAILRQSAGLPASVALVAQEHHENMDGSGYPQQLTVETLHPYSRIVSVVNAFETLCLSDSDCKGCQDYLAYESIMSGAGTRFDKKVAQALLSRLPMYPVGCMVELTDGRVGAVISVCRELPHRPQLKIIADAEDKFLDVPIILDLAAVQNQTLFIKCVLDEAQASLFIDALAL